MVVLSSVPLKQEVGCVDGGGGGDVDSRVPMLMKDEEYANV